MAAAAEEPVPDLPKSRYRRLESVLRLRSDRIALVLEQATNEMCVGGWEARFHPKEGMLGSPNA